MHPKYPLWLKLEEHLAAVNRKRGEWKLETQQGGSPAPRGAGVRGWLRAAGELHGTSTVTMECSVDVEQQQKHAAASLSKIRQISAVGLAAVKDTLGSVRRSAPGPVGAGADAAAEPPGAAAPVPLRQAAAVLEHLLSLLSALRAAFRRPAEVDAAFLAAFVGGIPEAPPPSPPEAAVLKRSRQ
jgi:hypothetical protein